HLRHHHHGHSGLVAKLLAHRFPFTSRRLAYARARQQRQKRTTRPLQLSPLPWRRRALHHLAQELATSPAPRVRRHAALFLAVVRRLLYPLLFPRKHSDLRHSLLLAVRHSPHRSRAPAPRSPRYGPLSLHLQCPGLRRRPLRFLVARRSLAPHADLPCAFRGPPARRQSPAGIACARHRTA